MRGILVDAVDGAGIVMVPTLIGPLAVALIAATKEVLGKLEKCEEANLFFVSASSCTVCLEACSSAALTLSDSNCNDSNWLAGD